MNEKSIVHREEIYQSENSTVEKGYEDITKRLISIKKIRYHTNEERVSIYNEIKHMIKIRNAVMETPALLDFYDDKAQKTISIYSEYINGQNLKQYISSTIGQPADGLMLRKKLIIFRNACVIVAKLHKMKIIHKDIKSENFVIRDNSVCSNEVFIIDLGSSGELLRKYIGTYGYQAPEVADTNCRNEITEKCDQYSMGIILYELIMNALPDPMLDFSHRGGEDVWKSTPMIKTDNPALQSKYLQINQVFQKMISYHPRSRYRDINAVVFEIEKIIKSFG